MSHPMRDVWIEMISCSNATKRDTSHPMRDVWIEIMSNQTPASKSSCHIPCGMCGLKLLAFGVWYMFAGSHPMRDVWIEIIFSQRKEEALWSHPMRDVWIEISGVFVTFACEHGHIPCGMCGLK